MKKHIKPVLEPVKIVKVDFGKYGESIMLKINKDFKILVHKFT